MSTISQGKAKTKKKKNHRLDAKFWTRVLVILLTLAMLAGTFYYIIVFSLGNSRVDAAGTSSVDDYMVRVAVVYGSSVTVDFKTVTDYGFSLGYNDSDNNFTEVLTTELTALNIAGNRNLTLASGRYGLASSEAGASVGAYHIKIVCDAALFDGHLSMITEALPQYPVFPGYYDGVRCVMIGQFTNSTDAETALSQLREEFAPESDSESVTETEPETSVEESNETTPDETSNEESSETTEAETTGEESGETSESDSDAPETSPPDEIDYLAEAFRSATVTELSDTALMVVDSANNRIVWEFDATDGTCHLGVKALQTGDTHSYIKGYKNSSLLTYDDVLECSIYDTEDYHGVQVINVLPVETYVTGVIPYEIGNSWPLETQKAFAIAVRSYAIANKGRHKNSYNADVCCSADCQVYKGFSSTNDLVRQAVAETKGLIAVYNGKICITAYSSSTGGCTANVSEVWGSSQTTYGYLSAVATPWEKYTKYGNGSWTSQTTGQQLYERLVAKGYTGLKGAVADIEITLGTNTSYVNAAKFYDAYGNSVTVKGISKVKSVLSLKSGNFVVAKAGETVTRTNFTMMGFGAQSAEPTLGMAVKTNPWDVTVYGRQKLSVLTSSGVKTFYDSNSEYVITADGTYEYNMSHSLDSQYYPTIIGVNDAVLPDIENLDTIIETETLTAEGTSGYFVFIGRGWGHGVGLSQWGIKDLGDLGYDFETIFKAYYSDVDIISFAEYLNS